MILLVNEIPNDLALCAESLKINCTYSLYKNEALFWEQDDQKAIISMLDGNMVIYNNSANIDELREFIDVISPRSVFSDADTLTALFGQTFHKVFVMKSEWRFSCDVNTETLSSGEIYKLLNTEGLEMPPYEHFAVDFCYRLNHGQLKYFALKEKCAAVGISDGQAVLVNGIASHKKGMGSLALQGLLSFYDMPIFAVCEEHIIPFYIKNNFSHIYDAGYWRKNS